ncbi:hypothetical protein BX666DRAFT_1855390 [Dichotomocladium elegans]|nr:hypothetical protein BX666DRAFT_1855390 [Dichotomocladium elegans]
MEPSSFPPSYYENFLESLARITSKLLTDREAETVLHSIHSFQEKLKRMSSQNLTRLQQEAPNPAKKAVCQHDGKTCTQNCTRGFIKAFAVGYGVKYLLAILPALMMGKVFKRDTAMFALFLSTFLSSYKGVLCFLRRHNASERQNAFIAGSVAGMSLIIDRDTRRRQAIMIYLFTRSFQFMGAWMMKQWAIQVKDEKDWEDRLAGFLQRWAGILVMMVANSELIYAMIFHQETISKSFLSFLLTHGDWKPDVGSKLAPSLMQSIGDTIRSLSTSEKGSIRMPLDTTSREYVATHISSSVAAAIPPNIRHKYILCALQHPLDPGCMHSKITLFRHEFIRALKLYVPLNVVKWDLDPPNSLKGGASFLTSEAQ